MCNTAVLTLLFFLFFFNFFLSKHNLFDYFQLSIDETETKYNLHALLERLITSTTTHKIPLRILCHRRQRVFLPPPHPHKKPGSSTHQNSYVRKPPESWRRLTRRSTQPSNLCGAFRRTRGEQHRAPLLSHQLGHTNPSQGHAGVEEKEEAAAAAASHLRMPAAPRGEERRHRTNGILPWSRNLQYFTYESSPCVAQLN